MADPWVVNASPLIALGNIGRLDLLVALGHDVVVPPAVLSEVEPGGSGSLPAELTVLDAVEPAPTVLMWGLGEGETEVLSYALRKPGRKRFSMSSPRGAAPLRLASLHGARWA